MASRGVHKALVAAVLGLLAGNAVALTVHSDDPSKKSVALARALLSRVALPPGSVRVHRRPPALLADAPERELSDDQVDRHALYRAPMEPHAVIEFLASHRSPDFSDVSEYGSAGLPGVPDLLYVAAELTRPPPGVNHARLLVSVIVDGVGSLLRVDVAVVRQRPRSAAETVSPSDRVVIIDRTIEAGEAGPSAVSSEHRVIADPGIVAQLADAFNHLPPAPPAAVGGSFACGFPLVTTVVGFSKTPNGRPDIVTTNTPCSQGWLVRVHGRTEPTLVDPATAFQTAVAVALA